MSKPKVLVIVGPTAAGKTSLSITLAKQFAGEVISADSRQVYTGMDLGTGKVTAEEMAGVPHHLLDVVSPMTTYTASDFAADGANAIETIQNNGHLPIIAGGTFFYIDMLLGRSSTPEVPPNKALRAELETLTIEELFAQLEAADPARAKTIDKHNARRIIRSLEIIAALGKVPNDLREEPYDVLTIGIDIDKETLHRNIHVRLLERLEQGMVAEVEELLAQGVSHERLEDLGLEYRYLSRYLRGELTYVEMVEQLESKTRQFAKRQMTWLKRDQSIHWIKPADLERIYTTVHNFLNNKPCDLLESDMLKTSRSERN